MKQTNMTYEEIGTLCQALSHLLHAGIGTADALYLLAEEETASQWGKLLPEMAVRADEGVTLAEVFQLSGCFPAYVCRLLSVGQQVGRSEETLAALGRYYHHRAQLQQRLRATLTYPAALLAVLLAVLLILLIWVLPVFNWVYLQLGAQLTGLAGGLLTLGAVLRRCLPALGLLAAVLGGLLVIRPVRRRVTALGKAWWGDRGSFGCVNSARFLQALALGVTSGMTEQEAAALAATVAGDGIPAFARRCRQCQQALDSGSSLPRALKDAGFLGSGDCRLLEAGTRSGSAAAVLTEIAGRRTADGEYRLEQAAGRLEPVMVTVACVLIGTVLLSVMLPLMNIMSAIG